MKDKLTFMHPERKKGFRERDKHARSKQHDDQWTNVEKDFGKKVMVKL